MKLIHILKSGKINEIPLTDTKFSTRHKKTKGKITHEGWGIKGTFGPKEHEYILMFTPEEAQEFFEELKNMLPRFQTENIEQFITTQEE